MIHVDSGDFINSDYVDKIIPLFLNDKKIGIVYGRYVPIDRNFLFQNTTKYIDNDVLILYLGANKYQNNITPGAGAVYSKEAIYSVGK
jgi:hypothetical protein